MAEENKIDKSKITNALKSLNKRFGENTVVKMSDSDNNIERFSSGRDDLDVILGGGYPLGKMIEISAENSCGKTGLALNAIKSMQSLGRACGIIDAENALNVEYCEEIGVDVDELYISQPDCGENGIEAIKAMVNSGQFGLIVVDSVSGLQPRKVIECESGEAVIGLHAKLMAQMVVQLKTPLQVNKTTLILSNQKRDNISLYGASEKTTGGRAIPFYMSIRLDIKNKGAIMEGGEKIGFKQQIKTIKNKTAPPFQSLEADLIYGVGVDKIIGFIDSLVFEGILEKAGGGWFKYNDVNIARGMPKLRETLEDNPELYEELKEKLNQTK